MTNHQRSMKIVCFTSGCSELIFSLRTEVFLLEFVLRFLDRSCGLILAYIVA